MNICAVYTNAKTDFLQSDARAVVLKRNSSMQSKRSYCCSLLHCKCAFESTIARCAQKSPIFSTDLSRSILSLNQFVCMR